MYTITISIMALISVLFLFIFKNKLNFYKLIWIMPFLCLMSWTQFIYFNNSYSIKAWEFNNIHILGISFFNTEIEDYIFTIVLSVILFVVFQLLDRRINTKSSTISKGLNFALLICITFFFYLFGGEFGKHQVFYMFLGIFAIWIDIKNWDVKQFWIIFAVNFLIAGGWDVWANNCETQQWFYRNIVTLEHSACFKNDSWWWFKIGKGWFPLSIFPQYYISGALLFNGTMILTNKFFGYKNEYTKTFINQR